MMTESCETGKRGLYLSSVATKADNNCATIHSNAMPYLFSNPISHFKVSIHSHFRTGIKVSNLKCHGEVTSVASATTVSRMRTWQ